MSETEQDRAYGRLRYHQAQALCALHAPPDPNTLETARRALEDDLIGTDHYANADARHLVARLWLLLRPEQDPSDPFHPARAALRWRPEDGLTWERILIRADYHLACLRFAAGIPPCDDSYHRHPSPIPARITPADPAVWAQRLRRVRCALAAVRRKAAERDEDHETDWYGSQARSREERLESILAALG